MNIAELMDQVRRAAGNTLDMLELKNKLDSMGICLENIASRHTLLYPYKKGIAPVVGAIPLCYGLPQGKLPG